MSVNTYAINVGYTTDDPLTYKKSVNWISDAQDLSPKSINVSPTSIVDQLTPTFIVDYDSRYLTANYVRCDALGACYFCKVSEDTAKRIILTCSIDPLSYDLDNCMITVVRNENTGGPTKIQDNKLPIIPGEQELMQTVATNSSLSPAADYCYVITVIGGEVSGQ